MSYTMSYIRGKMGDSRMQLRMNTAELVESIQVSLVKNI